MILTPQRRNVLVLALCQATVMTSLTIMATVSALTGQELADDKALATLPLGLQQVGVMLATFPASLDCIRPLGMYVNFGNASGPVPPFSLLLLMQKGSLFATRPTLNTYTAKRDDLLMTANDLTQPSFTTTALPSGHAFWRVVARATGGPADAWQVSFNDHLFVDVP